MRPLPAGTVFMALGPLEAKAASNTDDWRLLGIKLQNLHESVLCSSVINNPEPKPSSGTGSTKVLWKTRPDIEPAIICTLN